MKRWGWLLTGGLDDGGVHARSASEVNIGADANRLVEVSCYR